MSLRGSRARGLSPDRAQKLAALLVVITLIKGLLFAALVPAWQAPDEPNYFKEIVSLAESGSFVSVTGHPPLYAVAAYIPYELAGAEQSNKVLAVRLLSVVCVSIAVYFTFKTARVVFPKEPFIQILAPAVATFNPQFTFIGASVNSDSMIAMWFSIITYLSVLIIRDSLDWKKSAGILALCVLAGLTKQRVYFLYPVILGVVAYGGYLRLGGRWSRFWSGELRARDVAVGAGCIGVALLSWTP
ncbi:MAG: glycosyltransferase family 39 protein, partial [Chloroflexi bacterium]|nr:glycosyltransferase family 39 protein [Chloroflexota bacterium]